MRIKRWDVAPLDKALAAELAEACELHPFLSLLFAARGMTEPEEILSFLVGQEEAVDPFSFADMGAAVQRIQSALERKERILIYGDYDVDGITATVVLYTYLRSRGADVVYRIPLRESGYGLHDGDIRWAAENGVDLIITVDTGISLTPAETAAIEAAGMALVITDHHQPPQVLPCAVAVVDPHRPDCESGGKDYAGVGVAFMLICALDGDGQRMLDEYGDLLALGTLADAMPLRGFTRDLVRQGLSLLNADKRPGLRALRRAAGCADKALTATAVTYTLVPRLNAAGRMADPDAAARLLLAEDETEAAALAEKLEEWNSQRQQVSKAIVEQAEAQLRQHPERLYDRVLLVCGDGWHNGVLGIVAARLTEKYGKPAFVLSAQGDTAHGSGRSIPGFSLFAALSACRDILSVFGGHEQAAGLTISLSRVDELREQLNAYAAREYPTMPTASLPVALRLRPDQISVEMLALLDVLEPFGAGNASPLFGLYNMRLDNITALGGGKHLRLSLSRGNARINAVKFQTTPEEFPIPCGSLVNCVVSLDKNEYKGTLSVSVCVRDISYAQTDREALLADMTLFESIMRRETAVSPALALPSRELLAKLYSLLHFCGVWKGTLEQLQYAVARAGGETGDRPGALPLLVALELWREAALLDIEDHGDSWRLALLPTEKKADLTATPLWQYLEKGE